MVSNDNIATSHKVVCSSVYATTKVNCLDSLTGLAGDIVGNDYCTGSRFIGTQCDARTFKQ